MSNDSNGSPEFDLELDVDDGMSASVLSSVDPTDLELDRLIETGRGGQQPSTQADAAKRDGRQPGVQPIYCDLETVPDESRMELFDIPAAPDCRPGTRPRRLSSARGSTGKVLGRNWG